MANRNKIKLFVTGRHLEITREVRNYVEEKIGKLTKYMDIVNEAHVVITHEKYRYLAEITILAANGMSFSAKEETGDLLLSIDNTFEVLKRQVKKQKGKKFVAKRHRASSRNMKENLALEEENEDETTPVIDMGKKPEIIHTRKFAPKPMSVEEASDQMFLNNDNFIVFLNSQTNGVNVLYRRTDGNLGLIEPDF